MVEGVGGGEAGAVEGEEGFVEEDAAEGVYGGGVEALEDGGCGECVERC